MKWILILFVHAGTGVSVTTVDGFPAKVNCEAAGFKVAEAVRSVTYVCITRD